MIVLVASLLPFILALTSAEAEKKLDSCKCEVVKDYLILFDEYQSMAALWTTQVFVSKLARRLRGLNPENRVAVGVFSDIHSSFEESQYRKDHAFEQAILDLDLYPSAIPLLGNGLSVAESEIKKARKGNLAAAIFIVASKGIDDTEDVENEAKALALTTSLKSYVGYVIGIGDNLHENTLKALSVSGKYWKIRDPKELSSVELKLEVDLCSSAPKNRWKKFPKTKLVLFEDVDYKGNSLEIEVHENQCVDCDALPHFWSHVKQLKMSWAAMVNSVKVPDGSDCIIAYWGSNCEEEKPPKRIQKLTKYRESLGDSESSYSSFRLCNAKEDYAKLYKEK